MDIGFDTIGNAILIAYDRGPVLVTDPWLTDSAYFGSWGLSHEIPEEQRRAIGKASFVWVSHGHPDHLDGALLRELRDKTILLPDHVGGRISTDLARQGYNVRVLRDREWYPLSDRIRILCITDFNQDAILLIDINGWLVVNVNDAADRGWAGYVKKVARGYKRSFLLALSGRVGNADMINFFDEDGRRIPRCDAPVPVGKRNARRAESVGAKAFIPFSSMHTYKRTDSAWANVYNTELDQYQDGFESKRVDGLPAYIRYDGAHDTWTEIKPAEMPVLLRKPEDFGDYWDETLSSDDKTVATEYFRGFQHLSHYVDFITLRAGGKDSVIKIGEGKQYDRGVTFEAPRNSLMKAIKYQVFDDMLIGNFMKTTLHGNWGGNGLYPEFTPYVAKYGDNGLARSDAELRVYMREYHKRARFEHLRHLIETKTEAVVRSMISGNPMLTRGARNVYWYLKTRQ